MDRVAFNQAATASLRTAFERLHEEKQLEQRVRDIRAQVNPNVDESHRPNVGDVMNAERTLEIARSRSDDAIAAFTDGLADALALKDPQLIDSPPEVTL